MADDSHLDSKYFIDKEVYNCPYCNRRNVAYTFLDYFSFNWNNAKTCYAYFIRCDSCKNVSMHLTFKLIHKINPNGSRSILDLDIDSHIFYSVPTSFFVIDERIPKEIRELITEAEESLKMNFLTGASACMRKSIYELLIIENCIGENYDDKIKQLKSKNKDLDPLYINILAHIKDMTSDKVHEQSWDKWSSDNLKVIIEALKAVLYEIYVIPTNRKDRADRVQKIQEQVKKSNTFKKAED